MAMVRCLQYAGMSKTQTTSRVSTVARVKSISDSGSVLPRGYSFNIQHTSFLVSVFRFWSVDYYFFTFCSTIPIICSIQIQHIFKLDMFYKLVHFCKIKPVYNGEIVICSASFVLNNPRDQAFVTKYLSV